MLRCDGEEKKLWIETGSSCGFSVEYGVCIAMRAVLKACYTAGKRAVF